jgi:hypothetical protein
MGKILLMFAAMSVLILSARLSYVRPEPQADVSRASVGAAIGTLSGGFESMPSLDTQRTADVLLARADQADRPAAALLVYLAVILVGSVFGIAMTRRIPREL